MDTLVMDGQDDDDDDDMWYDVIGMMYDMMLYDMTYIWYVWWCHWSDIWYDWYAIYDWYGMRWIMFSTRDVPGPEFPQCPLKVYLHMTKACKVVCSVCG
jgi:hypothetical protein